MAKSKIKSKKYCSHKCQYKAKENKVSHECGHCGIEFTKPASVVANKHFCSKECYSKSSYLSELSQTTMTFEEYENWKKYSGKVRRLTEKTYNKYKDTINPHNLPRGIAGQEGAYQLDHIVPIYVGFYHNLDPHTLAEPWLLQMITWEENLARNTYWNDYLKIMHR